MLFIWLCMNFGSAVMLPSISELVKPAWSSRITVEHLSGSTSHKDEPSHFSWTYFNFQIDVRWTLAIHFPSNELMHFPHNNTLMHILSDGMMQLLWWVSHFAKGIMVTYTSAFFFIFDDRMNRCPWGVLFALQSMYLSLEKSTRIW
jgi:hypothetical protein